jgi:hypothetical protein
MPEITDATVLRRIIRFDEGEYPEFKAGARTTIVVKRAVFEAVPGIVGWDFWVYGFRKERSFVAPGEDESWSRHYSSRYQGGGVPEELHEVFHMAER